MNVQIEAYSRGMPLLNVQIRLKAARYGWLLARDHWDAQHLWFAYQRLWSAYQRLWSAYQRYTAAVRAAERELAALQHAREYGYWISQGVVSG